MSAQAAAVRSARPRRGPASASSRRTSAAASARSSSSIRRSSSSRSPRSCCGRPVKWIEDRREHFVVDDAGARSVLGRRDRGRCAMARILGVRGALIHDHGAYTARGVNVPYGSRCGAAARLRGARLPARRQARAHQQGAGDAGARRRPAARRVRHGAAARPRRARAQARSRRSAPPQSRAGREDAVPDAAQDPRRHAGRARQRRLSGLPADGAGARRLGRVSSAPAGGATRRAGISASASRTTSKAPGAGHSSRSRVRIAPSGKVARLFRRRCTWGRARRPCWRRSSPSSSAATWRMSP